MSDNISKVGDELSFNPWRGYNSFHKITIYVSIYRNKLRVSGKNIILSAKNSEEYHKIPLNKIRRIVFLGVPHCEGILFHTCARYGIYVDFLDPFGRPLGTLVSYANNLNLQYRYLDEEQSLFLAKNIICAKIENSWSVLQRKVKIEKDHFLLSKKALEAQSFETLRGVEGYAARVYFSYFSKLLASFEFHGRKARPAPDPVNMMLSFGYGMLHNRLVSSLYSHGIDAKNGFFHKGRGSHCALASDLMEEIRFVVDKLVLRLIRLQQIQPQDFKQRAHTYTFANHAKFKLFMQSFEKSLDSTFASPCARIGIKEGDSVNINSWIDSTAHEYKNFLLKQNPFEALRMAA